jgi:hypothetical protein
MSTTINLKGQRRMTTLDKPVTDLTNPSKQIEEQGVAFNLALLKSFLEQKFQLLDVVLRSMLQRFQMLLSFVMLLLRNVTIVILVATVVFHNG